MTTWQLEPPERIRLFSPIGLRLVDDMTDGDPVGGIRATLDVQTANTWTATKIKGVRTPAGIVAYPGLGRTSDPVGKPAITYRIRLDADFYIPVYRATADGIQFQAYPYNNTNDPQQFATTATETRLAPAPAYPFPSHIPVLRGAVTDASGTRAPDVLVFWGTPPHQERCITAADGGFALPLRLATGAITISAIDQRNGRHQDQTITLPGDLAKSWTLVIS
jgi:hypothetical protein